MGYLNYEFSRIADAEEINVFNTNLKARGAQNQYKYAVQCVKCGKIIYRKTKSRLINYPEEFLCGSCDGELKRINI